MESKKIVIGCKVRTTPQYESLPWRSRKEGVVESTNENVSTFDLGGLAGKETLSNGWIMRIPKS